jgi:hypothetical protein
MDWLGQWDDHGMLIPKLWEAESESHSAFPMVIVHHLEIEQLVGFPFCFRLTLSVACDGGGGASTMR